MQDLRLYLRLFVLDAGDLILDLLHLFLGQRIEVHRDDVADPANHREAEEAHSGAGTNKNPRGSFGNRGANCFWALYLS